MVFDVLDNQCMQVVSIVSRVTVISFMASEIDRLESSTLQMLIDSIDQVVDVGYQFGLVCSIHRCLTDDGIVFRLNVIGIHVELCLAQYFHEKIYLLNQRRYRKRFRTDRVDSVDFPRSYFFIYDDF
jgi:hypothetical protein